MYRGESFSFGGYGRSFEAAVLKEESSLGRQILNQLEENLKIAGEEMIPICPGYWYGSDLCENRSKCPF